MVNNAGVAAETAAHGPVWEKPNEIWDKVMHINSTSVFYGIKYACRVMVKQEPGPSGCRGKIVNLSSIYGQVAVERGSESPLSQSEAAR